MIKALVRTLLVTAAAVTIQGSGAAQCGDWDGGFELPGIDIYSILNPNPGGGVVGELEVWDRGQGPELYAAGEFAAAGSVAAKAVARWDGDAWQALGAGPNLKQVLDLKVLDDGSGPSLYACGSKASAFVPQVWRWDGSAWQAMGSGITGTPYALEVFELSSGPTLFLGGRVGITPATNGLRFWNGSAWKVPATWASGNSNDYVSDLQLHDDGSGPSLFVSGNFQKVFGAHADFIVRFDGAVWHELAPLPTQATVQVMTEIEQGDETVLAIAASFDVLTWDGVSWTSLGPLPFRPLELHQHTDGLLYASNSLSGAVRVARWDGSTWTEIGGGTTGGVSALTSFDDGSGSALYAGGSFISIGDEFAPGIARWDGSDWSALQAGHGSVFRPSAAAAFDDGSGLRMYMQVDVGAGPHVASWDGTTWAPLGEVPNGMVEVLHVHDDGTGPALYAGGDFTAFGATAANRVARWDGAAWQPLGSGLDSTVYALESFEAQTSTVLAVGGNFDTAGGVASKRVALWNGTTWSPFPSGPKGSVRALAGFDDGNGTALYAAGSFKTASGNNVQHIARWDGSNWVPVLGGFYKFVRSLQVFDDGNGEALFAGGEFTLVNNIAVKYVARWDGTEWSTVGSGSELPVPIDDLTVFDDGRGPALWTSSLHRWDGVAWTAPLGLVPLNGPEVVAGLEPGSGMAPALFIGGSFSSPDGVTAACNVASWTPACPCPPTPYCTAGTSASGCVAQIGASGVASASASSGFDLVANGAEGQKFGLFFFGTSARSAVPWGSTSSFKCVAFPVFRGALLHGTGTSGFCDGSYTFDLNAHWAAKPQQAPGAGATVRAQLWYRDPASSGSPKTAFSDAIEFVVCP